MAERHRRFCLLSRSFLWHVLRLNGERLLLGCAATSPDKSIVDIIYCQTQHLFTIMILTFIFLLLHVPKMILVHNSQCSPTALSLFIVFL